MYDSLILLVYPLLCAMQAESQYQPWRLMENRRPGKLREKTVWFTCDADAGECWEPSPIFTCQGFQFLACHWGTKWHTSTFKCVVLLCVGFSCSLKSKPVLVGEIPQWVKLPHRATDKTLHHISARHQPASPNKLDEGEMCGWNMLKLPHLHSLTMTHWNSHSNVFVTQSLPVSFPIEELTKKSRWLLINP